MKVLVLLNSAAGTLAGHDSNDEANRIVRGFQVAGVEAEVRHVEPSRLAQVAREARTSDFDVIIAGGGDGTLNTVANELAGGTKAFGVIPLGTHNHFAKDLSVPLDLDIACRMLAMGKIEEVPVAEVNGTVFLNFAAIGFHPEVIRHRDAQQSARGRSKWLAMIFAMGRVFQRFPMQRVRLSARRYIVVRSTPSVIICNNPHQMRVFGVENTSVPDRGLLNVYTATSMTRMGMVWLMLRAAMGMLKNASNFESLALPELRIDTNHRFVRVSIDGEVTEMRPPLHFRVRQDNLRVLIPHELGQIELDDDEDEVNQAPPPMRNAPTPVHDLPVAHPTHADDRAHF